jgi:RimJ/RimL family protein N-acetyltransferase
MPAPTNPPEAQDARCPDRLAPIRSARLELVLLAPQLLAAMLEGEPVAGMAIPAGWPNEHDRRFLQLRLDQVTKEPERLVWLPRAIVLRRRGRPMVGHIGFHGPPGVNGPSKPGALEVGYTVFEPHRRRGYASEAVSALLDWARDEHSVRDFVASVSPDNVPSLALVQRFGFRQTGRQWDVEDGEELVFELRLDRRLSGEGH